MLSWEGDLWTDAVGAVCWGILLSVWPIPMLVALPVWLPVLLWSEGCRRNRDATWKIGTAVRLLIVTAIMAGAILYPKPLSLSSYDDRVEMNASAVTLEEFGHASETQQVTTIELADGVDASTVIVLPSSKPTVDEFQSTLLEQTSYDVARLGGCVNGASLLNGPTPIRLLVH